MLKEDKKIATVIIRYFYIIGKADYISSSNVSLAIFHADYIIEPLTVTLIFVDEWRLFAEHKTNLKYFIWKLH